MFNAGARSAVTLLATTLLIYVAWALHINTAINHDVAWFTYAAKEMLAGKQLYRDLVEFNLPSVYLSALPAAQLYLWGMSAAEAVTAHTLVLALLSLLLCRPLLDKLELPPWHTVLFFIALAALLLFIPGYNFGQREHVFMLAFIPYVFLRGIKQGGGSLPVPLSIAIGVFAALGCSLKPHFVLVAVGLELALYLQRRFIFKQPKALSLQPEMLALGGTLSVIAALLAAIFPLYWQDIIPTATKLYGGYDVPDLIRDFSGFFVFLGVTLAALTRFWKPRDIYSCAFTAFAAAGLFSGLIFIQQGKGWDYHALPFLYSAALLALMALAKPEWFLSLVPFKGSTRWVALILLVLQVGNILHIYGLIPPTLGYLKFRPVLAARHGPFYVMATEFVPGFPLAFDMDRTNSWAGRYPFLVTLPGIVRIKDAEPYATQLRHAIADDLNTKKPLTVITIAEGCPAWPLPPGFYILNWFLKDAEFAKAWSAYKKHETLACYDIYWRR